MSDQPTMTVDSGMLTPANGTVTVSTVPTVTTPVDSEQEPPWLPKRLERARSEGGANVLKEFGVNEDDLKDLKGGKLKELIEQEKARRDAEKSDLQKAQERITALEPIEVSYKALLGEFTAILDAELAAVPDAHKETVKDVLELVGEDPVKRMQAIRKLKPSFVGADETKQRKQPAPNIDGSAGAAASGRKGVQAAPEDELRKRFRIGK